VGQGMGLGHHPMLVNIKHGYKIVIINIINTKSPENSIIIT